MRSAPVALWVLLSTPRGASGQTSQSSRLKTDVLVNFTLPGAFDWGRTDYPWYDRPCPGFQYGSFSDVIAVPSIGKFVFTPMFSDAIGLFDPVTYRCARGVLPTVHVGSSAARRRLSAAVAPAFSDAC